MNLPIPHLATLCFAAGLVGLPSASALTVTIEAPGVQQTTVAGTITESFNSLTPGPLVSYSSPLGTFAGGQVVPANVFGGANSSLYYAVGTQSASLLGSLTFATDQSYFGMWWSALDGQNRLEFYDSTAALLASYRTADIIPLLSPAYFSNPNGGGNSTEHYVYLNFTVTSGPLLHQVIFRNDSLSSGFEMDNLSVLSPRTSPPGTSVPEGGSPFWLTLATVTGLLCGRAKLANHGRQTEVRATV